MLWIGYHVQALTGYPAGTDEGPAIDGYGNMMFWEGHWQTLLPHLITIGQLRDISISQLLYIAAHVYIAASTEGITV